MWSVKSRPRLIKKTVQQQEEFSHKKLKQACLFHNILPATSLNEGDNIFSMFSMFSYLKVTKIDIHIEVILNFLSNIVFCKELYLWIVKCKYNSTYRIEANLYSLLTLFHLFIFRCRFYILTYLSLGAAILLNSIVAFRRSGDRGAIASQRGLWSLRRTENWWPGSDILCVFTPFVIYNQTDLLKYWYYENSFEAI